MLSGLVKRFEKFTEENLWFYPILTFLIVWEFSAGLGLIPIETISSPSAAISSTWEQFKIDPEFPNMIITSYRNTVIGIVMAILLALPIGIASGLDQKSDASFAPVIMLLGALPDLALLPLLVFWYGHGNAAAIIMTVVVAFFPLYFATREGARTIPEEYFHVAKIFGAGKFRTFTDLIFPGVWPSLLVGLRTSFQYVFEILLAIEIMSGVFGIGTFIQASIDRGLIDLSIGGIFIMGIMVMITDRLVFAPFEHKISVWRE
jgi:ABC-type nitrate/sulfonate/bicarbonate transport system permease component